MTQPTIRDFAEGRRHFAAHRARLEEERGIVFMDGTAGYVPNAFRGENISRLALDAALAADAEPILTTTSNSAIPALLTTFIDPDKLRILFARNAAARILGSEGRGERKKGDWTEMVAMFPVIESTGQVSSYGDYATSGNAGTNFTFPQRQSYHYQAIIDYGEREVAMAAKAQINISSEKKGAQILVLDKFQNQTYFFGVQNLQNYGLLNDPSLPAAIQPGPKAYNSQAHGPWITAAVVTATANEIYTDIQSLFSQVVSQTDGLIDMNMESRLVLAMSPNTEVALTSTNSFNVNVFDQLRKNFPNIRFERAVQYATTAGNLVQMWVEDVEGQETGYCAFTEKLRAHPLIQDLSSWRQKMSQGTWGAVIRQPFAVSQMLGV